MTPRPPTSRQTDSSLDSPALGRATPPTTRQPTTRRTQAAALDITTIRHELAWLAEHLGDLDVIAHSPQFSEAESAGRRSGPPGSSESPALASLWQPRLRGRVSGALRLLKASAVDLTACRVGLEQTFGGRGANAELIGTDLEPGEIDRLRAAKARRDERAGDPRAGEWEARPAVETQPDQRFRGGR